MCGLALFMSGPRWASEEFWFCRPPGLPASGEKGAFSGPSPEQSRWSPRAEFFQPAVALAGTGPRLVQSGSISGNAAATGNACNGHNTNPASSDGLRQPRIPISIPHTSAAQTGGEAAVRQEGQQQRPEVKCKTSSAFLLVINGQEHGAVPLAPACVTSGEPARGVGRWGNELERL